MRTFWDGDWLRVSGEWILWMECQEDDDRGDLWESAHPWYLCVFGWWVRGEGVLLAVLSVPEWGGFQQRYSYHHIGAAVGFDETWFIENHHPKWISGISQVWVINSQEGKENPRHRETSENTIHRSVEHRHKGQDHHPANLRIANVTFGLRRHLRPFLRIHLHVEKCLQLDKGRDVKPNLFWKIDCRVRYTFRPNKTAAVDRQRLWQGPVQQGVYWHDVYWLERRVAGEVGGVRHGVTTIAEMVRAEAEQLPRRQVPGVIHPAAQADWGHSQNYHHAVINVHHHIVNPWYSWVKAEQSHSHQESIRDIWLRLVWCVRDIQKLSNNNDEGLNQTVA